MVNKNMKAEDVKAGVRVMWIDRSMPLTIVDKGRIGYEEAYLVDETGAFLFLSLDEIELIRDKPLQRKIRLKT